MHYRMESQKRLLGKIVWFLSICSIILLSLREGERLQAAEEMKALRMIVVQDRQRAEDILQQLKQGASFSAAAHVTTIGPGRQNWGYAGIVRIEEVQEELRSTLRKLKPGQFSDILEVEQRFVILKALPVELEKHVQDAEKASDAGQLQQAIKALQAALRLEEDNVQIHLRLGMVYGQLKQFDASIRHLELAQQYIPREAQIAMLRGAAYTHAAVATKNADYVQRAMQAYQQAMEIEPGLAPSVHFGLGKIYIEALGQPEQALPHLEKAVAVTPRVPGVYRLLIQAHYELKHDEEAWRYLNLARSLGYQFPELQKSLQERTKKR